MRRTLAALGGALSILLGACSSGDDDGNFTPPPPPSPPPPPAAVPQLGVQQVFTQINLSQPLVLVQAPGNASLWYAVERNGVIRVFDNDPNANSSSVFLDISAMVSATGEGGLLGFAFHPDFPNTPEAFVSYTRAGGPLISYVSRFSSNDAGATLDAGSEQPLMVIPQNRSNHNGGDIKFGPDGYLYIAFGDGGGSGDPDENAQDLTNVLGALLRIDVDGLTPYEIPPDNPFVSDPNLCVQGFGGPGATCPEIYAYGLRNPWRFSFDSQTGELWLGDVGQGAWEEVDIIENGGDYGWDDREGAHCYEPASGCIMDSIDPITEYGRNLGNSITGGYVYRGSAIPDLAGWYVFGDFGSGRVFGIPADSAGFVEPEVLDETGLSIVTFGEDLDGELYVTDIGSGDIYQIVDAP